MAQFLIFSPSGWWHRWLSRSWVGIGVFLYVFWFFYGFRTCWVGHLECACLMPHISNFWSNLSKTSATPTAGRYENSRWYKIFLEATSFRSSYTCTQFIISKLEANELGATGQTRRVPPSIFLIFCNRMHGIESQRIPILTFLALYDRKKTNRKKTNRFFQQNFFCCFKLGFPSLIERERHPLTVWKLIS